MDLDASPVKHVALPLDTMDTDDAKNFEFTEESKQLEQ